MYYDDQTRRFNVLSGLIFGTVLGAGLALLTVPQAAPRSRRRKGLVDGMLGAVAEGRKHLERRMR